MAKKKQEDIEKEILAEVEQEVKAEKPKKEKPKKKAPKKPLMEQVKQLSEERKAAKAEAKEEKKPKGPKKPAKFYTVPLATNVPRQKKARKAIIDLKNFTRRHTKAEEIVISKEVNETIWARGRKKPPRQLRVKLEEDDEGRMEVKLK
jgi:large subunit ribosomal protein L31e